MTINYPTKEQFYEDYFVNKINVNTLAKNYGYSHNASIYDIMKKYGFESRKHHIPTREQLLEDYVNNNLQIKEIAEKYNLSCSYIGKLRKQYNIGSKGTNLNKLQRIPFTQEQIQIVRGTLMGDGYASFPQKASKNASLEITHTTKQSEYVQWLSDKLSPFISSTNYRTIAPRFIFNHTTKECYSVRIRTICHPSINDICKQYYPNGSKVVTLDILNQLDPLALAVWIMDDGTVCSNKNGLDICTGLFEESIQQIICDWFLSKWNLKCKYRYLINGGYRIVFPMEDSRKLAKIIYPFFENSMLYKINQLL